MLNTATTATKISVNTKTAKDIEVQYLIGQMTAKHIKSMLSNNFVQTCQIQAEAKKLWMVTLFILELQHEINNNIYFRKRCIDFLLTCEDELTLLHMLTTRSRIFNEQEIITLVLRLVKFAAPNTVRVCANTSKAIPENIRLAMSNFA